MNWLVNLTSRLSGYRTYLSAGATILASISATVVVIATTLGGLDLTNGAVITASLMGFAGVTSALAQIFQRAATASIVIVPPTPQVDPFANVPDRSVRNSSVSGLVALLLVSSGSMLAAEPVAIVNGPRTAESGEEVILDASKSEGSPTVYKWRVYPELKGRKQLTVLEGGSQVRLATFPGRYLVRLMVANADGISDQDHIITIPGTPPCPPTPDPTPGPEPTPLPTPTPTPLPVPPTPLPTPTPPLPVPAPDLPPGEFDGLPAAIKALALSVVSPTRAAEAAKLADAFEALGAQLAAGTLKTPISIVAAIGSAFNAASTAAWDTAFRPAAVARMKALYDAGKLSTPERWRAMLIEAATGLRAVK